jgi:hypothetical protein
MQIKVKKKAHLGGAGLNIISTSSSSLSGAEEILAPEGSQLLIIPRVAATEASIRFWRAMAAGSEPSLTLVAVDIVGGDGVGWYRTRDLGCGSWWGSRW